MVGVYVPALVGVPVRTPVYLVNVSPGGRPDSVKPPEYGGVPPLGVNVTGPYTAPTTPFGRGELFVSVGGGLMVNENVCSFVPPPYSVTVMGML
jgi:hypothetical protein